MENMIYVNGEEMSPETAATASGIIGGVLGASFVVFAIIALVFYLLEVIAYWKIFIKAGKPSWHSIIPILNNFDEIDLSWNRTMAWVGVGISLVSSIIATLLQTSGDSTRIQAGMPENYFLHQEIPFPICLPQAPVINTGYICSCQSIWFM